MIEIVLLLFLATIVIFLAFILDVCLKIKEKVVLISSNAKSIDRNIDKLVNSVVVPQEPSAEDILAQTEKYLQSLPGSPTRRKL